MKKIIVDSELIRLLKEIMGENNSIEEWRQIESCDMFQSPSYFGGFDATEDKFTFSYYDNHGKEYWFELSIQEIDYILCGDITSIKVSLTD